MVYLLLLTNLLTLSIAAHLIKKYRQQPHQSQGLQAKEELFRALIEHSSDMIIVTDAEGVERYISPSVTRVLGYTPQELIVHSQYHLLHPDEREHLQERFLAVVQSEGASQQFTLRLLHKDNTWRSLQAIASNQLTNPMIQGIVMNIRDLTENKRLEDQIIRSEEWFRTLIDNVYDLIQVLDKKGRAVFSSN